MEEIQETQTQVAEINRKNIRLALELKREKQDIMNKWNELYDLMNQNEKDEAALREAKEDFEEYKRIVELEE